MLRRCIKKLSAYVLYAVIGLVAARYAQVLLCDVWRWQQCVICR